MGLGARVPGAEPSHLPPAPRPPQPGPPEQAHRPARHTVQAGGPKPRPVLSSGRAGGQNSALDCKMGLWPCHRSWRHVLVGTCPGWQLLPTRGQGPREWAVGQV